MGFTLCLTLYRLHKNFFLQDDKESSTASVVTKHSFVSRYDNQFQPGHEMTIPRFEEIVVPSNTGVTITELDRIFDTSPQNTSFESSKLKAYIRECWDVQHIDDEFPTGVHPDRYLEFVGGLCQYACDKHSSGATQSFSYDTIYVSRISFGWQYQPFHSNI